MSSRKKKVVVWCDAELSAALQRAKEESGVPIAVQVRMALREFLPPYETRNQLRDATLKVGRRRRSRRAER